MTAGILVHPDGRTEAVDFDPAAQDNIVGGSPVQAAAAFSEETTSCRMVFNSFPEGESAEPNPIASLARMEAATGNSRFFVDPTRAVTGVAVFYFAAEKEILEGIEQAARAVENYKADYPEEYRLWHNAVMNLEA